MDTLKAKILTIIGLNLVRKDLFFFTILLYLEDPLQVRNQKFFRAGKVSENKSTSVNI